MASSDGSECVCDTKRHFVADGEDGCRCDAANNYALVGSECVQCTAPGFVASSDGSECVCDTKGHFVANNEGGCQCDLSGGYVYDGVGRCICNRKLGLALKNGICQQDCSIQIVPGECQSNCLDWIPANGVCMPLQYDGSVTYTAGKISTFRQS